jgi:exopolyphosphatase
MQENNFRFIEDLLIIGNQAADLDSSVSAYALAELLRRLNPEIDVFSLIQGSPADLLLKPEIKSLFLKAEIPLRAENFTSVFFNPDSDSYNLKAYKESSLIMVDHNEADSEEINHPVAGIVDHHIDSLLFQDLKLRDIRICGSCASIISEYWEQCDVEIPYGISLLLAGAIAVDTGYLDPSWGKTTDIDRSQYEALSKTLTTKDRAFIEQVLDIKNNLSHLGIYDQLRRDYKDFPMEGLKGGISSIPLGQKDFFDIDFYKDDAVMDFSIQNCPDFLMIMHTVPQPFKRELSLYIKNSNKAMKKILKTALTRLKEPGLDLVDPDMKISGSSAGWILYSQKNIKISRKLLVPLLKDELEKLISKEI